MMCRAIDYVFQRVFSDHVRIVDEDGPKVNCHKEGKVQVSLNWEDEYVEVVRHRLSISIYRVEGVRSKRSWDYGDIRQIRRGSCDSLIHL